MDLTEEIKILNEAYRKGKPLVSDSEYDELVEKLRVQDPNNELLKKAIVETSTDRMEKLPFPMFSLEKVKTVQELLQWIQACELQSGDHLVITPKYDGISLLIDEKAKFAWTRGDGIEGQRSDNHYKAMSKNKPAREIVDICYSYGEAIFTKKNFLENKGTYKSARNCVAGLFNSPDISPMLSYAEVVRYGTNRDDLDKDTQLSLLKSFYTNATSWMTTTVSSFLSSEDSVKNWLNGVFNQLSSEYKCDGLVVDVNYSAKRKALGRLPNGNPRFAIAYKDPSWAERADTIVKEIEWNISKDGKAKPVVIFDPIELCGATVQRATAYNAKYLVDNNICTGAVITIARSGDVIPKHLQTLSYSRDAFHKEMDDMMICSSCGEILTWNNTTTELVCKSPFCRDKEISKLVYFFSTLKIEEFGEPTIRRIFNAGFESVAEIFEINRESLLTIEGIGDSLADIILSQVEHLRKEGVPFARLLTAYNVFEGVIAEKTCQKILDELSEEDLFFVRCCKTVEKEHLLEISGIGEESSNAFNKGLVTFDSEDLYLIKVSYYNKPKIKAAENQMSVCFSGIRDTDVESKLEATGHKVVSGVSSKTTHLVMKTIGSGSSKETKASKLGITVMTLEDFKRLIED